MADLSDDAEVAIVKELHGRPPIGGESQGLEEAFRAWHLASAVESRPPSGRLQPITIRWGKRPELCEFQGAVAPRERFLAILVEIAMVGGLSPPEQIFYLAQAEFDEIVDLRVGDSRSHDDPPKRG
jgi:hypothetical protein